MAVPISGIVDRFVNHYQLPWPAMVGAGCVCLGFVFVSIAEYVEKRKERKNRRVEARFEK